MNFNRRTKTVLALVVSLLPAHGFAALKTGVALPPIVAPLPSSAIAPPAAIGSLQRFSNPTPPGSDSGPAQVPDAAGALFDNSGAQNAGPSNPSEQRLLQTLADWKLEAEQKPFERLSRSFARDLATPKVKATVVLNSREYGFSYETTASGFEYYLVAKSMDYDDHLIFIQNNDGRYTLIFTTDLDVVRSDEVPELKAKALEFLETLKSKLLAGPR